VKLDKYVTNISYLKRLKEANKIDKELIKTEKIKKVSVIIKNKRNKKTN
jgi:hypothetical protein